MRKGLIVKCIADLYTVQVGDDFIPCKARGLFRKNGITPLAGDCVAFQTDANGDGWIEEILPRKNFMERPSVANIDRLYLIVSAADPAPVPLLIDRLIAVAFDKEIQPILVLNKTDLASVEWLKEIYKTVPMPVISVCAATGEGCEELKASLSQTGISVLSGNSGVGKSTLLNQIDPQLSLATGQTSKKLGRGRHTTRHTQLYSVGEGYVADTPGFSSLDMEKVQWIYKENLVFDFPEFMPFVKDCRFADCHHLGEKDCAVAQAVQTGQIHQSRLDSYRVMYKEADAIKDWQRK
jgi:ribosome biogenesis GTPase